MVICTRRAAVIQCRDKLFKQSLTGCTGTKCWKTHFANRHDAHTRRYQIYKTTSIDDGALLNAIGLSLLLLRYCIGAYCNIMITNYCHIIMLYYNILLCYYVLVRVCPKVWNKVWKTDISLTFEKINVMIVRIIYNWRFAYVWKFTKKYLKKKSNTYNKLASKIYWYFENCEIKCTTTKLK